MAKPRLLYPRERDSCSLYRRLGEPQNRYGCMRKISPPPGFHPHSPARLRMFYQTFFDFVLIIGMDQGCTNAGRHVAVATKFSTLGPNIFGALSLERAVITLLVPGISRWLLYVWKICSPLE